MAKSAEPKPIEFTAHADERMAQRGISRNQIVNTIRQPSSHGAGGAEYTQRLEREFPPSRRLAVIVEDLPDRIKVVTVFWMS